MAAESVARLLAARRRLRVENPNAYLRRIVVNQVIGRGRRSATERRLGHRFAASKTSAACCRRNATMPELDPEIRSAFDRLAEGPEPSDTLVAATLARSVQIRRRRNALAASGVAAVVLAVTVTVAAIAGADTHGPPLEVSGPSGSGSVASSTTSAPATTAPASVPPATTRHTTATRRTTAPTTIVATPATGSGDCAATPQAADTYGVTEELQPNGDVKVAVSLPQGPDGPPGYTLDDGTTGNGNFEKTYAPVDFGMHWADVPTVEANGRTCPVRYSFNVAASLTSTTLEPVTTVPPDTSTVPETTTTAMPN